MSGVVDHVVDISTITREKALADGQSLAITRAIDNGAQAETVAIVEKSETQLAYLKGGATRVQVKAVGDLAVGKIKEMPSFKTRCAYVVPQKPKICDTDG